MLYTHISLAEKYNYLEDKFTAAYAFLRRTDLAELAPGAYPIVDGVVANVQHYTTQPADAGRFETHDRFFDIQYVIEGMEQFGVVAREGLVVDTPYNAENDITFYQEPAHSGTVLLAAGDLVVVAPEDAHKPRCIAGEACAVKKIVVKVCVD